MTLRWYQPPRPSSDTIEGYLEHLSPIGVRWQSHAWGAPPVHYRFDDDAGPVAEIGDITVHPNTGLTKVWPYRGVGGADALVLAASAQLAFIEPPVGRSRWQCRRRGNGRSYWFTSVIVHVGQGEGMRLLMARHRDEMSNLTTTRLTGQMERAGQLPE